jgi:S1-C subfamily serine protease
MDELRDPFDGLDELPEPLPPHAKSSGRRWIVGTAAATVVVVGAAVGFSLSNGQGAVTAQSTGSGGTSSSDSAVAPSTGSGGTTGRMNGFGHRGQGYDGDGDGRAYGYGSGGRTPGGTTSTATAATAAQQVGVVDIVVTLGYQQAQAAGTGMILTANGEVLTNNHVVDGATNIKVTVVSTGRTYSASVVGDDPTQDVAVIQLKGASGLKTVSTASAAATVGASVVGVGNAGGAGGTPSAAAGKVVALGQSITARDDDGTNAERLSGLIETDAPIASGDSGGPLFDSANEVVGMDTAISSGGQVQAYAIPISRALAIAKQIEAGQASATINIGVPGFLGVDLEGTSGGATVTSVVSGSPAEAAGLQPGDVITALGGTRIGSAARLSTTIGAFSPGDRVTLHWTDTSGRTHHATVTLVEGPAK